MGHPVEEFIRDFFGRRRLQLEHYGLKDLVQLAIVEWETYKRDKAKEENE